MPKGTVKIFAVFLAVAILLIFLNAVFRQNGAVVFVTSPFSSIFLKTQDILASGINIVFNLKNILEENADLKSKNNTLGAQLVGYSELEKENELLRKQLEFQGKKQLHLMEVKIISFDPNNLSKFVIINKGMEDGIKNEMPVIMSGNILLGKVFQAYSDYSQVILITDQNNKVNVKSEMGDYNGILNGYFGKLLFMDLIEKGAPALEGDLIITSGLDGVYPENLIVGYANAIKSDDNAVFKQAYLKAAFLPLSSNLAFVIVE